MEKPKRTEEEKARLRKVLIEKGYLKPITLENLYPRLCKHDKEIATLKEENELLKKEVKEVREILVFHNLKVQEQEEKWRD